MDYPFTSDGCSIVADLDMRPCCVMHDWAYWQGGTAADRATADKVFRLCIQKHSRYRWLAWVRWFGVRVGGLGILPTPFRWGYGWRWPETSGVGGTYTTANQRDALKHALGGQ